MKTELICASNNAHKITELKTLLQDVYAIRTMAECGVKDDIPENGKTFEENALIKAQYLYAITNNMVIADDSGLVVPALNGAPGVFSARYAGTGSAKDNTAKLLQELKTATNRYAYFVCVICLIADGKPYFFEGKVEGYITTEPMGEKGFGYDPVFVPLGYDKTFAQLGDKVKNQMSHRTQAVEKLRDFLSKKP